MAFLFSALQHFPARFDPPVPGFSSFLPATPHELNTAKTPPWISTFNSGRSQSQHTSQRPKSPGMQPRSTTRKLTGTAPLAPVHGSILGCAPTFKQVLNLWRHCETIGFWLANLNGSPRAPTGIHRRIPLFTKIYRRFWWILFISWDRRPIERRLGGNMGHICNVEPIIIIILSSISQDQGTKLLHRSALEREFRSGNFWRLH